MKATSLTLAAALDLIPKVLQQRYAQTYTFAKAVANDILQDMEKEFDSEYYKNEYPLIIIDGVTDYTLSEDIRKFRGLYEVPADWVIPDKKNPISVDLIGTRLRLLHTPVANDDEDLSGTVTGFDVTSKVKFEDTDNLGTDKTDNQYRSALTQYTVTATGLIYSRINISNDTSDSTVTMNGDLPALPAVGDTYNILHNYYIIEALDYIQRVTDETAVLPIAQDWDALFRAGLRFYYDKQTDQESNKSKISGAEYSRLLLKAGSDEKRKQGDYPKPIPRDFPDFNKHDSSTRFGPHGTTF